MKSVATEDDRVMAIEQARVIIKEHLELNEYCFTAKTIARAINSVLEPWLIEDAIHDLYSNHDPCFAGAARYFDQQIYYFRAPDYVLAEAKENK